MSILNMLYLAAIFAAVFGCSLLLAHTLIPSKAQQRLKALSGNQGENLTSESAEWVAKVAKASGPLARLSTPGEEWRNSALRIRFMHAGFRGSHVVTLFFAAKTMLTLTLPALVWLAVTAFFDTIPPTNLLLYLLAAAAIGFYLPNALLARAVQKRQRKVFEDFPDALDLMTICIEAGLGVDAAIARVAQEMLTTSPVVSEELHLATLELRAGSSKEKALRNLGLRTGAADVDALATMLIQAEQFGTSIGNALRVHSEHLRAKRRVLAEESAAKVAVKLLMPLIFCIFPALIMVMMGPAFLQIYRVLLPTMAGQ